MASKLITSDLRNAFLSYRLAENEFNRPNEDVVTLCACNKMRTSVEQFLRSYLRHQDIPFSTHDCFEDLLGRCGVIDKQFNDLNLSCFTCSHQDSYEADKKYCFSLSKMRECFIQTRLVKDMVFAKLCVSESDFEQHY